MSGRLSIYTSSPIDVWLSKIDSNLVFVQRKSQLNLIKLRKKFTEVTINIGFHKFITTCSHVIRTCDAIAQ